MAEQIEVKYISPREIGKQAVAALQEFGVYDTLPVPIERIIDNQLKVNIVTIENLQRTFDVNSCISGDLSTVYVDTRLPDYMPLQFNFALAHELGHLVLHDYIYKDRPFSTIDGYKRFICSFKEGAYTYFEMQAHSFAGHFLVPMHQLEKHFERESKHINGNFIEKIKEKKLKFNIICHTIARRLSPAFQVHERPIAIRIEQSRLVNKYFGL